MKKNKELPIPVKSCLRKLGSDIKTARLRRRLQTVLIAERAMISRMTLNKIENGNPNVSMANYASVLFVLGMLDRLKELADIKYDLIGQAIDENNLPKRIRLPLSKDKKE